MGFEEGEEGAKKGTLVLFGRRMERREVGRED